MTKSISKDNKKIKFKVSNKNKVIKRKKNTKSNKSGIKYSEYIKFLRSSFNKDIYKLIDNIIMDCKIEYEDFLKIIISRNLINIESKHWKHLVNEVNGFDNTYPLFWACEHACLEEVKLLLANGAEFKPISKLDKITKSNYHVNKNCFEIILTMITNNKNYGKISFKMFMNKKLNKYENKIIKDFKNYQLILKLLIDKYDLNIVYNDSTILEMIVETGHIEFIELFLLKFDLYDMDIKIKFFNNFKYLLLRLTNDLRIITSKNDNMVCYKEYLRLKIIYITKISSKFFEKMGLSNFNHYDNKVEEYFGDFYNINLNDCRIFRMKLSMSKIGEDDDKFDYIFYNDNKKYYKLINNLFENLINQYNKNVENFLKIDS